MIVKVQTSQRLLSRFQLYKQQQPVPDWHSISRDKCHQVSKTVRTNVGDMKAAASKRDSDKAKEKKLAAILENAK